jgi:hypothetical protein
MVWKGGLQEVAEAARWAGGNGNGNGGFKTSGR